jgi:hypothetical protein
MDDARFDSLAKAFVATVGSRRRLLGALTAGLLGASPLALSGDQAAAKKRKKKKKKPPTAPRSPVSPLSPPNCTPTTCAAQGKNCGAISDGCGGTLQCGSCTSPKTCGGGNPGTPGVCGCTKATCAADQCGQPPDGCGGTLTCIPATDTHGCWVLAGSADPFGPDARIRVADDLTVSVNGQVVAKDDDGQFSEIGPFIFPAQPGDDLRIVASNVQDGARELSPLFVWHAGGGAKDLSEHIVEEDQPAGTFVDFTVSLCLERGEVCQPGASQCCSRSCCGSEVDPTDRCRGGCG